MTDDALLLEDLDDVRPVLGQWGPEQCEVRRIVDKLHQTFDAEPSPGVDCCRVDGGGRHGPSPRARPNPGNALNRAAVSQAQPSTVTVARRVRIFSGAPGSLVGSIVPTPKESARVVAHSVCCLALPALAGVASTFGADAGL